MKKGQRFTIFLFLFFVNISLSQNRNNEINDKLNLLFLNIDTTIKPEKIENEYRIPYDSDSKKNEPEKNRIEFVKHPSISNFYRGNLNVTYLFDKKYFDEFGIYKIKMYLYFDNKTDCIVEYNKIVESFENFGITKIVTTTKSEFKTSQINSIETLFLKNQYTEFPRLEIFYGYEETENSNYITITLMKSWNNKQINGIKFFSN